MTAIFDRRRIQAPEVSHPYASEAGPSRRERSDDSIFLKTGLITQANGSGYIEAGNVKIACSVYGPRPRQPPYSPQGSLNLEVKFAPFASHPRRAPLRDTEPAPLSALITSLLLPALQLHLLPKSAVDVHLLILESDSVSNVLSAGLTVASAAIANAGIPMFALGIGATVMDSEEGVVGVLPALDKLSGIWLTGDMSIEEACDLVERSATSAKQTHGVLARALLEGA